NQCPSEFHSGATNLFASRSPIMLKTWRFAGVLRGVALVSTGCDKSGTTPPPGKPKDETNAKKLIGVWEGTDKVFGPVSVEFKADNGVAMSLGAKDKDPLQ